MVFFNQSLKFTLRKKACYLHENILPQIHMLCFAFGRKGKHFKSATAFFVAKYLCMRYFSIFNAKKAIFTLVSGRDGFLYHHRILLLQWNLLDTTLVTTALEGS